MKDALKHYHISAAIFIAGSICLIVFTGTWLLGIIGLLIGYEIIELGMKNEGKTCNCHEKKCCEKDSGDHHEPTTVGNDGERKGENN